MVSKKGFLVSLLVSVGVFFSYAVEAADSVSGPEVKRAQALLKSAVKYLKEKDERALQAFNQEDVFTEGELYVFVIDSHGKMLASGGPSLAMVGQDVSDLKDVEGKAFIREIISKSKTANQGEVEYRWLNRKDNKVEKKVTLFERVGDRIVNVGYYQARASADSAKALLEQAVQAYAKDPQQALAAFNALNSPFKQDDLYVFAVNLKEMKFIAHGASPKWVGVDAKHLASPDGRPVIAEMAKLLEKKEQAELSYEWRNPVSGKIESKHSFLRKQGDILLGVGYYTR